MENEIKPDYYDGFTCIADQCSFTCCQEWKIAVDNDTLTKWKNIRLSNQKRNRLDSYVSRVEDSCVIKLDKNRRCPFLNEQKLCKLVMEFGDKILSETCTIFPRQINKFTDRKEYSLVACCPAVIDLWNQQDKITFICKMSSTCDDLLFQIRNQIIDIMQNTEFSNSKSLMMIFYMLLDLQDANRDKNLSYKTTINIEKELRKYEKKDILYQLEETINQMQFSTENTFEERNELFLDLVENYRKQDLYTSHLEKIVMLAEEIAESYDRDEMEQRLQSFEKEFASYERLFNHFLVAEIFSNGLMPDFTMETMIVMTQWIAIEYAVMKHTIFLRWLLDGAKELPYRIVRDYMVMIARMTGYEEEDISEYMESSFESLIWDWGYLALLIGNVKEKENEKINSKINQLPN